MELSPADVDAILQAQADAWYEADMPRLLALDAALWDYRGGGAAIV